MKIGILTFHRAHNYGAVLQLYALTSYLKSLGKEIYVIDYYNKYVYDNYKFFNLNRIKCKNPIKLSYRIIKTILLVPEKLHKRYLFKDFLKKHFTLIEQKSISTLDCIIVGSDQVWNPKIVGGFKNQYFGYDIPKNIKLVSYAASTEINTMTTENLHKYKESLRNFKNICVREKKFAEYLSTTINQEIQVCIDPTLLLEKNIWEKFAIKSKEKNYVLVYQARANKDIIRYAEKIAEKNNSQIIILTSNVSSYDNKHIIKKYATPEEFVGYFMNAKCVIALSFHAVVFSIIAQVPFYAIRLNDGWDNRVESLLRNLNLLDRFVTTDNIVEYSEIDYDRIDLKIKYLRDNSKEYLKAILS